MKKTLEGLLKKADHLRNSAKVEEAIKAYLELVDFSKQSEEFYYTARALHLAGVSAIASVSRPNSTKYRDAQKYFQTAEKVYREIEVEDYLGDLFRDMAVVNDYARLKVEALKYFQKSVEELESSNNIGSLAMTYDKLGLHYYLYNDLLTAKKYIKKALGLFRQDPSRGYYQATTWMDYAKVLAREGEMSESIEWAEQSLDWYQADHDGETFNRRKAQLYGILSILYDQEGREKQAKTFASRHEKLLKQFDPETTQILRDELRNIIKDEK